MPSRSYDDLLPDVARRCISWVQACAARGVSVLVYCTYRSPEEQDALYAQGRDGHPGSIVTNARAWQSWHNVRRAWDAVPTIGGKPLWAYSEDSGPWQVAVEEADRLGIEWGGHWQSFPDRCHWQASGGMTLELARMQLAQYGEATG